MLEQRFREFGAIFEAGEAFTEAAIRDERLITGQNPVSRMSVARLLLETLCEQREAV